MMKNKHMIRTLTVLLTVMLCMTAFSTVAFASSEDAAPTSEAQTEPTDSADITGDDLSEQHVVGPVGAEGADARAAVGDGGAHGDGVDAEHDRRENGQGQNAVGDDPVDLVGDGETARGRLLLHRLGYHAADVGVPLVGDDALRIVVHFLLAVRNMCVDMGQRGLVQFQLLLYLFITLKKLNGIKSFLIFGNIFKLFLDFFKIFFIKLIISSLLLLKNVVKFFLFFFGFVYDFFLFLICSDNSFRCLF